MRRRQPTGQPNVRNTEEEQTTTMKRTFKIAAIAATALTGLMATAGSANAATADAAGAVTVTKGDIQAAMGWNSATWEAHVATPAAVEETGKLITTSHGNMPVDVPGGWLTLNGQIVANYPS